MKKQNEVKKSLNKERKTERFREKLCKTLEQMRQKKKKTQ